jgi:outer membrane lipoprotein-sorting protein
MINIILLLFSLTADELLEKIDTVRAPRMSESLIKMRNYLSDNREITYKLRVVTERKKATYLEILEPAREAGRKFLLIENDIWMYTPEVGKSIRLSARDKFLGSEFSNSDLMESSYEKNFKASSIDSAGNYYLFEIEGKSREAPYKRITMKVRKSNFIPSELQYYTMSGRLFREMTMDSIKTFEGQPYATYLKMSNVLSATSYTEVKILSLKSLSKIPPSLFKPENLSR